MKLIVPIFLFLLGVSCGKKDEEKTTTATVLEGTWAAACEVNDTGSGKKSVTFQGTSIVMNDIAFGDASCTSGEVQFAGRVTATFAVGSVASTPADATNLDISGIKMYATAKNDSTVTAFNSAQFFGMSDWALNVEKEVTGLNGDGTASADGSSQFEIFKITGNTLCFGKKSETNDGSSAAKRPTELETSGCLTKQ